MTYHRPVKKREHKLFNGLRHTLHARFEKHSRAEEEKDHLHTKGYNVRIQYDKRKKLYKVWAMKGNGVWNRRR